LYVQLRAQADATRWGAAGRVEHVSAQAIRFHSLDAFVAFIGRMLAHAVSLGSKRAC